MRVRKGERDGVGYTKLIFCLIMIQIVSVVDMFLSEEKISSRKEKNKL